MARHGKKYTKVAAVIDSTKKYTVDEALDTLLQGCYTKFDESIDVAIKLGVDPRHADQMVRSTVVLPNGTGKKERVLVFAKGEKVQEALDAGADYAGGDEFVDKIKEGWIEFDKTIATPDMMGTVGKIGRVLGPRGMMPNAKLGTVTFDVSKVVGDIKAGKVDFKADKAGIVHSMVGKASFGAGKLRENLLSFVEKIIQLKPSSSKGIYLKGVSISSTMGPGIKLDTLELRSLFK
ncbi:MAG: 50S ribosomal protein L1 [Desulfobulbaceae bacterium]|uniref:Large ribosomal subunit protein uL1 n=1 Tax=Candidatus Desulfobia pelagia TaxID=2841692 RepID=A0A8J6NEH3_9BACT|nr:50S ribosomal protein L1 [Candidatus Desulfobia pelagia]